MPDTLYRLHHVLHFLPLSFLSQTFPDHLLLPLLFLELEKIVHLDLILGHLGGHKHAKDEYYLSNSHSINMKSHLSLCVQCMERGRENTKNTSQSHKLKFYLQICNCNSFAMLQNYTIQNFAYTLQHFSLLCCQQVLNCLKGSSPQTRMRLSELHCTEEYWRSYVQNTKQQHINWQ